MLVNVVSKRGLFEQAAKHPDAKPALEVWFDTASAAQWTNLEDVRKTYPATDTVGDLAIFNIRGNQYRLIVRMAWKRKRIYVKEFLTYAEYDIDAHVFGANATTRDWNQTGERAHDC